MMYSHSCGEVRLVDRDGDAARHQDADVAVEPLGARVGEDARALALADAEREQAAGDLARRLVPLGPGRRAPGARLLPAEAPVLAADALTRSVNITDRVLHAERRARPSLAGADTFAVAAMCCLHVPLRRDGCNCLREGGRALSTVWYSVRFGRNEQLRFAFARARDLCAGAVRAGALGRRLAGAARDVPARKRGGRSGSRAAWSGCFARSARPSSRSGRSCRRGPICFRRT